MPDETEDEATLSSQDLHESRARAVTVRGKPAWQKAFLEAFSQTGVVTEACKAAGISLSAPYKLRKRDPEFDQEWLEAEAIAAGVIEAEMVRRAVTGLEEYVVSHGKVVEYQGEPLKIRKYSDQLLIALAKARMPEKFSDKVKQEITTTGTGAQLAQNPDEVKSIMVNLGAGLLSSLLGAAQSNMVPTLMQSSE